MPADVTAVSDPTGAAIDHLACWPMDVVVSGSSGFIGTPLLAALGEAGHRPIRLVRRPPAAGADEIEWDIDQGKIDAEALNGVGAVIHLAGAGIGDKRWTEAYKRELVESRTKGTSLLASTLAGLNTPPKVFVSGSAIGFYGDRGDEELTESSEAGSGFLADLVVKWEAAAQSAIDAGIRTVLARTGIVLDKDEGALEKLLLQFKFFLGGKMGAGSQWMSWISLHDEVRAILHLLESDLSGPVNLTAPAPSTNAQFTKALGSAVGRPSFLPVPSFGPRLLLGKEMADGLLFDSARILPAKLEASGFEFAHPDLETALTAVLA